uniref:TolC family protein n=1 Tax=Pelomonas sp. KK5 TaxID=1855730 RepID=UPI00097CA665
MSAFLLCAAALAAAQTLAFDQALDLSVQRSEAARAARAAAHGATESSRAAAQLPDPMLRAGIDNQPTSGGREPMTMKRIGLSQEWVPADKRAARAAVAEAMGEREATQSRIAEADARLRAALAYVDAWYADAALQLAVELEARFREEMDAARARLAGAGGEAAPVLGLAAELGTAEDESEQARQQQAGAFIALQRWVGLRPDALAPLPALAMPAEEDFVAGSPAVLAARRELELARRGADLAAKEVRPNWTWEVAY